MGERNVKKKSAADVSRRKFLAGVAVAGAATTVAAKPNGAQAAVGSTVNKRLPSAVMPTAHQIATETGGLREPTTQIRGPSGIGLTWSTSSSR